MLLWLGCAPVGAQAGQGMPRQLGLYPSPVTLPRAGLKQGQEVAKNHSIMVCLGAEAGQIQRSSARQSLLPRMTMPLHGSANVLPRPPEPPTHKHTQTQTVLPLEVAAKIHNNLPGACLATAAINCTQQGLGAMQQ